MLATTGTIDVNLTPIGGTAHEALRFVINAYNGAEEMRPIIDVCFGVFEWAVIALAITSVILITIDKIAALLPKLRVRFRRRL